jgi:hypothetical protein
MSFFSKDSDERPSAFLPKKSCQKINPPMIPSVARITNPALTDFEKLVTIGIEL